MPNSPPKGFPILHSNQPHMRVPISPQISTTEYVSKLVDSCQLDRWEMVSLRSLYVIFSYCKQKHHCFNSMQNGTEIYWKILSLCFYLQSLSTNISYISFSIFSCSILSILQISKKPLWYYFKGSNKSSHLIKTIYA